MLSLRTANVDLKEWTMRGGVKTEAGKNRLVPVHSKIQSIVQKRFEQSKAGYLFEYEGKEVSESKYREIWADLMDKLKMKHTRMSAATPSVQGLILPGQIRCVLIDLWGISRRYGRTGVHS